MPLCIDLFCGLGGWTEGFLAEGWGVIGFDIERHEYPERVIQPSHAKAGVGIDFNRGHSFNGTNERRLKEAPLAGRTARYPAKLVLQDVLTLHGSQFRNADCIVASPPCQKYSYMAMPWTRAKTEASWQRYSRDSGSPFADPFTLNDLFNACFRIQREASEAAGHHIPMVVENVVGAQAWVGRAEWHFASYYLWGDVPALMPHSFKRKNTGGSWFGQRDGKALERNDPRDMRRNGAGEFVNAAAQGGWNHPGKALDGTKNEGGSWFAKAHNTVSGHSRNPVNRAGARKAASAEIAKIPFELSSYIARVYKP